MGGSKHERTPSLRRKSGDSNHSPALDLAHTTTRQVRFARWAQGQTHLPLECRSVGNTDTQGAHLLSTILAKHYAARLRAISARRPPSSHARVTEHSNGENGENSHSELAPLFSTPSTPDSPSGEDPGLSEFVERRRRREFGVKRAPASSRICVAFFAERIPAARLIAP